MRDQGLGTLPEIPEKGLKIPFFGPLTFSMSLMADPIKIVLTHQTPDRVEGLEFPVTEDGALSAIHSAIEKYMAWLEGPASPIKKDGAQ